MVTRPIGEVFEWQGKIYRVVGISPCNGCAFLPVPGESRCKNLHDVRGYCSSSVREDEADVIFVEVPEQRDEKSMECGITSSDQFTVGSHAVIRFQNGIRVRGRITKVEGGKYFLKTPAGSDLVAGFIWMEVATAEERRLTEEEEKAVPE